jgi:hypothetical protein
MAKESVSEFEDVFNRNLQNPIPQKAKQNTTHTHTHTHTNLKTKEKKEWRGSHRKEYPRTVRQLTKDVT